MLGDDPPYLSVGTEVSAKYKGAFCEAKIRKVVRSVKCRVTYKQGLGTATVADDQIKGTLRVGASVEARHGDRKEFVEATITKIQDCSQYTVVFDDGDITTLRRTALCLKSGRHFAESETLDQLPLTHPEHFSTPVIGGRRGRRSRQAQDESSEDEDSPPRNARDSGFIGGAKEGMETEPEIGRVVCVELGDKKKKDNWFPGLVVAPTAQDTVRIRVRDDYLVRSFKDARYYTVPKKEATEFTKELVHKVENSTLKVAVEKALLFLEKNELPPHWDRDSLFGHSVSSGNSDSDGELDTDSSDDEPREEKDHFVAQLYKFMDDRGTPINNCPMIGSEDIDLYRLFRAVYKLGGYNRVTNQNQWKTITRRLSFAMQNSPSTHNLVKQAYKKFLHSFEDFYRKLGCTMVNHPRGSTRKQRPGRSLIRDKDRNTPVPPPVPSVKNDKEEDEKKVVEDEKKEKKEVKKEQVKEEEIVKIKKKEEAEGSGSGQESDINVEVETESSSSSAGEKPPKAAAPVPTLPSSTNTSSSRAKPKSSKEETKKKTVEKKKTENKKQEKKDEKPKEEEATKTRSKAKDDTVKNKGVTEGRETRTPSREAEKKTLSKQRRLTDEELKKRGRKRKEYETEKSRADEQLTETAPSYKGPVDFGDRLKVYYGPTHESKVTYEAKVIDIEKDGAEPMYLVHYTGWNTRYDEWIKASRIAQNFTQAQGRVKRTKTPRPQTPSTNLPTNNKSAKGTCNSTTNASQSRRRAQSVAPTSTNAATSSTSAKEMKKDEKDKDKETTPQPIRASTPLSIASSSSRTKSPATPANNRQTRTSRNTELSGTIEHRRRTRRMSGHTDISVVSESEGSDVYDSDITEPEQTKTRLRGTEERKRKETRSRVEERIKAEDVSDAEDEKDNLEEPRKGRRLRRTPGKTQSIKSEPDSDEEQPKGRDFDLNQIRSELKGFDKAVKMELVRMEPEPDDEVKMDEKENIATITRASPKLEKLVETPKVEAVVETKVESTEDIYEFKEPEPFEFEVRSKRDTSGEKDKLKKKMFEDEPKSPKKKQKITPMSTTPAREAKNDSTDGDSRPKKPRKLFTNKRSDEAASETAPVTVPQPLSKSSAQPTPSVCEDAFDKLCESPSFNQQLKPAAIVEEPTKVASSSLNLLFSDLPADDEVTRDDSEDRLIISETEVSEAEQDNSFSYQQEVQLHGAELSETTESSNKNEPTVAATVEYAREETPMTGVSSNTNNKLAGNNSLDQKQNVVKLSSATAQSELRLLDTKLLDLAPIAPLPIVTPPAPISARLPATSTIEEKLSAAAMAFRNKAKDNKRDNKATLDEDITADVTTRKLSKLDITILQRTKDDEIDEQEKKREQQQQQQEETAMMSEEEQRREIMRFAIKQKEEELQQLKLKKEAELKKFAEAKTIVAEHKMKLQEVTREDSWKSVENEICKRPEEEYKTLEQTEKDRIETRKKPVNPDILDSTDSSDSEQRLVIDNEEPQDVKISASSNFDVKLRAELDRLQDTQERYARTQTPKTSNVQHHVQQQQQQECVEVKVSSDIVSSVSKTDEEGETMNSLLCEEEIPGSPAPPGSESIEQASADPTCNSPKNEVTENSIVLMEMPFASAPTSGQSTTCSSSTVATLSMSLPKTVEASVPVSLPMQQNVPLNIRQQQHQQHQHQQQLQHQQQQQQQLQHHQQQQHQQHMPAVLLPSQRRESNEAAPVMDNTPPTTPDSSISNITGSPREERTGGSSPTSEDNIKLNRDSSEADNDSAGKGPGFSEDDTLPISESNSIDRTLKPPAKRSICDDMHSSPKKRKRNRKHSECGGLVAPKKPAGRQSNSRHAGRYVAGSDSDDTSEGSNLCTVNTAPTAHANLASVTDLAATYSSRSPRPTKYNFYVELDPELDASQRIAVLQQKLTELRKTYNAVKVELATIERRRKKLRRREREAVKAAKAEMQQACS